LVYHVASKQLTSLVKIFVAVVESIVHIVHLFLDTFHYFASSFSSYIWKIIGVNVR